MAYIPAVIFVIFIIASNPILISALLTSERPVVKNLWREELQAVRKPEDPRTLYPIERHCLEPVAPMFTGPVDHNAMTSWSLMFSRYTLDAGDELDTWLANQEEHPETKAQKHVGEDITDILIPVLFPIFFIAFLSFSVIFIPILGAVGYHLLLALWWLLTHTELRRIVRRILIIKAKIERKRELFLLPKSMNKLPKNMYHLPTYFRIESDEEVPKELGGSGDENESFGDVKQNMNDNDEQMRTDKIALSELESETEATVEPPPNENV